MGRNNGTPSDRINKGYRRWVWLYHCKLNNCCNFISSTSDMTQHICKYHRYGQGGALRSSARKASQHGTQV